MKGKQNMENISSKLRKVLLSSYCEPAKSFSAKKTVCGLGGILSCAILCQLTPPANLAAAAAAAGSTPETAMRVLGITALAVLWWTGELVSDWLVTIVMLLLWILLGHIPFATAFSTFTSTSVWLIVGSFCLATATSKTGLFKRISWLLIRLFSPTFRGQVLAILLAGTVCAPLIPSATAKAILGASIAKNIADAMGYEPESHGRCGLFLASFIGFSCTTPAFMSGSIFTYTLLGTLPQEARASLTWTSWLLSSLPWLAVVLIGSYFFIQIAFSPKEPPLLISGHIEQEYAKLGKMQRDESISAVLLSAAVILWILEEYLGINAAVTALMIACLCFASGILDAKELSVAVPWDLVIFLGGVLNLGSIFSMVGINAWLQELLLPFFENFSSPFLIVIAVAIMVVLLRFILVSQSATIIIMMAILTPVALSRNIHPFIIGFVVLSMGQCWFLSYQNSVFIPALSCMQGTLSHGNTVTACIFFESIALAGCLLSIPFWGLFPVLGRAV